jgi:hypothetical protein
MTPFLLEKWYLDVSDSSPAAFIGYAAVLRYREIQIPYTGYSFFNGHNTVKRNSFRRHPIPEISDAGINWQTRLASGTWERVDPAVSRTLLEEDDRVIDWQCLIPKARTTVSVDGRAVSGLGYAEKITLTFMPWKLPIRELHWGRFLSNEFSVIWIRWIGQHPKDLVFLNGKEMENPRITKTELVFEDFTLLLTSIATLREGNVGSTVFKNFPAISRLFPSSILKLEENKWLSNGKLMAGNSLVATGHAIHEVVIWK